jgi:hypothetical protein
MITDPGPDGATATFNDARTHRFALQRIIDPRQPDNACAWVLLNPSTADAFKLDPTLKRCAAWTLRWGFGSMLIVNLFSFRSPKPKDLLAGQPPRLRTDAIDPFGDAGANDAAIVEAVIRSRRVVCAWGNDGDLGDRWRHVLKLVREHAIGGTTDEELSEIVRLGTTQSGQPTHPLARGKHRVPDDVVVQVWR